jgi:hypothetical protein
MSKIVARWVPSEVGVGVGISPRSWHGRGHALLRRPRPLRQRPESSSLFRRTIGIARSQSSDMVVNYAVVREPMAPARQRNQGRRTTKWKDSRFSWKPIAEHADAIAHRVGVQSRRFFSASATERRSMTHQLQNVTFELTSPEPRAWLVLTSDNQEPRVVEMQQRDLSMKFACPDLIPDDYRCRDYCGDDRNVTYHGPATTEGSIDGGMDALMSVKIPKAKRKPQVVQ